MLAGFFSSLLQPQIPDPYKPCASFWAILFGAVLLILQVVFLVSRLTELVGDAYVWRWLWPTLLGSCLLCVNGCLITCGCCYRKKGEEEGIDEEKGRNLNDEKKEHEDGAKGDDKDDQEQKKKSDIQFCHIHLFIFIRQYLFRLLLIVNAILCIILGLVSKFGYPFLNRGCVLVETTQPGPEFLGRLSFPPNFCLTPTVTIPLLDTQFCQFVSLNTDRLRLQLFNETSPQYSCIPLFTCSLTFSSCTRVPAAPATTTTAAIPMEYPSKEAVFLLLGALASWLVFMVALQCYCNPPLRARLRANLRWRGPRSPVDIRSKAQL